MERSELEPIVELFVWAILIYVLIGLIVAAYFHLRVLHRTDTSTVGAGVFFRLLITPGLSIFWPLMVLKFARFKNGTSAFGEVESPVTPRGLRSIHGFLIIAAAVILPMAMGAAVYYRAPAPDQPVSTNEGIER